MRLTVMRLTVRALFAVFAAAFMLPLVYGAASFEVTAFSCSPDEVKLNSQFSCTATVQNTGDASGTLNTATLYPDATNWLESSNYPQTVNTAIGSGESAEVIFSGLKGKKSGDNGFARIMLDEVTDTFVADTAVTVNVIDVVVTAENDADEAEPDAEVDVTAQATAGGNIDLTLSFSVNSGGCSIGAQASSADTDDMTDGQTTSHTWTVTIGTSDCSYTVTAAATSNPSGTASKTDSDTNTISCSGDNCTVESSSSSSSGGGGGGGGGTATTQCSDKKDNDGDGLIDLDDPGCQSSKDDDEADPVICVQKWYCAGWSACKDGKQTRDCADDNDCLAKKALFAVDKVVEIGKPETIMACAVSDAGSAAEGKLPEEQSPGSEQGIMQAFAENKWLYLALLPVAAVAVYFGVVFLRGLHLPRSRKK